MRDLSKEDEGMEPPPPGCRQLPSLGDKPANARPDYQTPMDVTYVCCVLTGDWPASTEEIREKIPDLGAHYVECLYSMVSRYAPLNAPWRFTCFTDRQFIEGIPCKPIPYGIYGTFAKLYAFAEGNFPVGSRVLFFDLDTAIVADWTPLAQVPIDRPVMLRDTWAHHMPASGVMSWHVSPETTQIWEHYKRLVGKRPPYYTLRRALGAYHAPNDPIRPTRPTKILTDEHWIQQYVLPDNWRAWQELLPEQFLSFKYQVASKRTLSPEQREKARVVYFHGNPRPHDVIAPWNPFWRGILDPALSF